MCDIGPWRSHSCARASSFSRRGAKSFSAYKPACSPNLDIVSVGYTVWAVTKKCVTYRE